MQDSIFTKIIKGEIPCHKVYEDDKTLAFMDIHPIQPGHVLVVPKKQIGHFFELPDEDYQALMATVKKVATRLKAVFAEKPRVGIIIEGFDLPDHVHVKVFPAGSGDELRSSPDMSAEPDHAALAEIAQKLAF
jgi:histidine triad (HIT) family protein